MTLAVYWDVKPQHNNNHNNNTTFSNFTTIISGVPIFEPPYDKTNKMDAGPAKTQMNLGTCPV